MTEDKPKTGQEQREDNNTGSKCVYRLPRGVCSTASYLIDNNYHDYNDRNKDTVTMIICNRCHASWFWGRAPVVHVVIM